jgi:leader peptidase (prepilin peptidase)/N-methyltransferase
MGAVWLAVFFATALAALGAIIGSFTANLCLRWPRGESVVGGRSKCDSCGRVLGPLELIPVMSRLALGGRCKSCGAAIDPLHWRVEIASMAIGAAVVIAAGPSLQAIAFAVLGWLLLPLAILDWRYFWLPDRLTSVVAVAGLALGGFASDRSLLDRTAAAILGYLALSGIAWLYRQFRGVDGMGRGDPKLFGALGLWIGLINMPLLLVLSASSGIVLALLDRPAAKRSVTMVAFGTMMCLAALPTLVMSREFL